MEDLESTTTTGAKRREEMYDIEKADMNEASKDIDMKDQSYNIS